MAIKTLLITLLSLAAASASNCCSGYKLLQYRRASVYPVYDCSSSPCGNICSHPDDYCDSTIYPSEPISKYDRYYPSYQEPKTITHKCVCSKSIATQRLVTAMPRYYKRGYCCEPLMDQPCGHYGQYECGQYAPCNQCGQYPPCNPCPMPPPPPPLYRQPPRMMPLSLPASCVC